MEYISALFEEFGKILQVFGHIDLRGGGFRALVESAVKLIERDAFAEVIEVIFAVELIVEADIADIFFCEMFFGEVCC